MLLEEIKNETLDASAEVNIGEKVKEVVPIQLKKKPYAIVGEIVYDTKEQYSDHYDKSFKSSRERFTQEKELLERNLLEVREESERFKRYENLVKMER
jgi:hypothetical protein